MMLEKLCTHPLAGEENGLLSLGSYDEGDAVILQLGNSMFVTVIILEGTARVMGLRDDVHGIHGEPFQFCLNNFKCSRRRPFPADPGTVFGLSITPRHLVEIGISSESMRTSPQPRTSTR